MKAARSQPCSPLTCSRCIRAMPRVVAGRSRFSMPRKPILVAYKSVTVAIKAPVEGEPDSMPYGVLKFEGGVHRVQRVPVTESQGRLHTSAAGVLVMPEVAETEVDVDEGDLRIDVYRSSGPGGQGVNTTDSAVRITHLAQRHRRLLPE